ncbi:MAG TPA: hypothetical protein DF383_03465, partial [Deltaproteobacteria bacterium]|nr:hypothetical protein [Deltaproteobacteria bacterium]
MKKQHLFYFSILSLLMAFLFLSGTSGCGSGGNNGGGANGGGNNGGGNNGGGANTVPLSITVTGIGEGAVTSDLGGINCSKAGGTCQTSLSSGSQVTLTATAAPGYFFNGWLGGACPKIGTCTLSLNAATAVQASFINIAYQSSRDLDPAQDAPNNPSALNLWFSNADKSNSHALAATAFDSFRPIFSPDGDKLSFVSNRPVNGASMASQSHNLWVVNADGSDAHSLTALDVTDVNIASGSVYPQQWSPNGGKILFTSTRDINSGTAATANLTNNLWVIDADGSNLMVLAGLDVADVNSGGGQWSPDGSKILFSSTRNTDKTPSANPNNDSNIWLMNADGSNPEPLTQITTLDTFANFPIWSPDGSQIAFESNRSLSDDQNAAPTAKNIWIADADGNNIRHLTQKTAISSSKPQWSPDGSLIAFLSNQDIDDPNATTPGPTNIWAIKADGSEEAFPLTRKKGGGAFIQA